MQDSPAEFPEVKATAQPPEPQVEKGGGFKIVTAEDLDFLHDFNKDARLTERLNQLKQEDPQSYEHYQDIDGRRLEELRRIEPPYISEFHRSGRSETERNQYDVPKPVSFEEMHNRLQNAKQWEKDWNSLSNEEKLTHYNRIRELRSAKNIPEGDPSKQNYDSQIADMERDVKGVIQDLEGRVKMYDLSDFEGLKKLFDGNPPTSEKAAERWFLHEKIDPEGFTRLKKAQERYQRELDLKEPPFAADQSRFYDLKPVGINRVSSSAIDQMDIPALKALLERSEAFSERWDKLSDAERIEQLKRVRQLKGGTLLEGEMEGIRPYLKEGETVESKGVEFWSSGIKSQIKNVQEAVTAREAQKQQQELEPTRTAIEAVSHERTRPVPQEAPPPPPPPAPKGGFLGRMFRKK